MSRKLYGDHVVKGTITSDGLIIEGAFTFPSIDGTSGQILVTDGAGNVTWEDAEFVAPVDSVNGKTGDVILITDDVSEGSSNLYYTNERVDDRVANLIKNGTGISWSYNDSAGTLTPTVSLSPFSTSNLSEGSNLYYTNERVDDRVAALVISGTGTTWTYDDGAGTLKVDVSLTPFTTDDLTEGSALYYTDERVDDRIANLIQDTTSIAWTYVDGSNTLEANVQDNTTTQRVEVLQNGILIGTRKTLNLIGGSGVSLNISDNSGDDRIDVTIDTTLDEFIALDDLSDVDTTSTPPTDGDILTYVAGSPDQWQPRKLLRSFQLSANRDTNVTNSYLDVGNMATNSTSYVMPFNCRITAISASTPGTETWTAEIRKNGGATPIVNQVISADTKDYTDGLSVSVQAGDIIEFYCNGSGVNKPFVTIWLEEE